MADVAVIENQGEEMTSEDLVMDSLEEIVQGLEKLAEEQVSRKAVIEDRWYEDLRQYHGRYDADTEATLEEEERSKVFVNQTRSKTHAWEARLADLLFPTDDRNWGIEPTPNPELHEDALEAIKGARTAAEEATAANQNGDVEAEQRALQVANQHAAKAQNNASVMEAARRSSEAMQREIDDQLKESRFNIIARDGVHDACKLGTCILKGPLTSQRNRRRWNAVEEGGPLYQLQSEDDKRPEVRRVNPWSFFPDMSAARIEDAEFTFERHLMTKKDLRKLAKRGGFQKKALKELLEQGPQDPIPTYVNNLRDITGSNTSDNDQRYTVWEYHGPLEEEQLQTVVEAIGQDGLLEKIEISPLFDVQVIVWFCQGRLIKFGLHPLDSDETLYAVFNFERDDSSIFGFGVPFLMRDSQSSLNGAWRMMMDNGALSAGPQVVIDKEQIEPENDSWVLSPRKIWVRIKAMANRGKPFEVYHIDSKQGELAAIVKMSKEHIDDETNLPLIAHGDQASHITKTEGGMAMLMNSVNVVFRRVVRNFDDDLTTPIIRRFYDWNMQFSKKTEVKGDFEVVARGSSVLLVREIQAKNLMQIIMGWSGHPKIGNRLKIDNLARKTLQANMIPSDDVYQTDEEIRQQEEQEKNRPPPPDPEAEKLKAMASIEKMKADSAERIALMKHQTAMMQLAEARNMKLDDLQAKLKIKGIEVDGKERALAAEIAMKERTGDSAGGSV